MNDAHPTILAIDVSSTTLGYVLYRGAVVAHGECKLAGDIAERCAAAYNCLYDLLSLYGQPDALAIEAPVARFAKAVIPQARVSGALLTLAAQRGVLICEVTPAAAKLALTGRGNSEKVDMQVAALRYGVSGEHASDALGVALYAAQQVQVVV